jgi:hypothetical protein
LKAAGVEVVAGVPRAALSPPARPGEALAAFKALGAQARAAKSTSVEDWEDDPLAPVPEVSYERIMEFLRIDDDDLRGPNPYGPCGPPAPAEPPAPASGGGW